MEKTEFVKKAENSFEELEESVKLNSFMSYLSGIEYGIEIAGQEVKRRFLAEEEK